MAISILALGVCSAGISGYVLFAVLPPFLSTVDQTAQYLADIKAPDIELEDSAAKIRRAADSTPSCPEQQYGGCSAFDLRETKAELDSIATPLESMDGTLEPKMASLEDRIHQIAGQLAYLRPMMMAVVGWMFTVSVVLSLGGAALLLIDKRIERKVIQRGAKESVRGSRTHAEA